MVKKHRSFDIDCIVKWCVKCYKVGFLDAKYQNFYNILWECSQVKQSKTTFARPNKQCLINNNYIPPTRHDKEASSAKPLEHQRTKLSSMYNPCIDWFRSRSIHVPLTSSAKASSHTRARWSLPHFCQSNIKTSWIQRQSNMESTGQHIACLEHW